MEKEDYYQTLNTINSWLQNCDTKVSILIGLFTIVLSFLFSSDSYELLIFIFDNYKQNDKKLESCVILLLLAVSLLIFLLGMLELISALLPRRFEQKPSMMFWGSIASNYKIKCNEKDNNVNSYELYEKHIKEYTEEKIVQDLTYQICACANIASIKFQKQKKGTILSTTGLILMMIFFITAAYCF